MAHRVAQSAETNLDDGWLYAAKETSGIEIASRLKEDVLVVRVVHGRRHLEALFGH